MNAHRQDMVNVELTVDEIRGAIEGLIEKKYPFLDSAWELNDISFITKNLHGNEGELPGAMFYYVKQVDVDAAPHTVCDCRKCLKDK